MVTSTQYSTTSSSDLSIGTLWEEIYPSLRIRIRRLVYSLRIPSWHGQEEDIVEDILQETARRVIEHARKAERGEAKPIYAFEHMVVVIACNYCRDLRRRDRRLSRIEADSYLCEAHEFMDDQDYMGLSEVAIERVYQKEFFTLLAHEIVKFPDKQREVLLIDLANRMCFETQPTDLQEAFLNVGIRLLEYQQPLPNNSKERSRCSALLYHAYRRIAHLSCVQQYVSVA